PLEILQRGKEGGGARNASARAGRPTARRRDGPLIDGLAARWWIFVKWCGTQYDLPDDLRHHFTCTISTSVRLAKDGRRMRFIACTVNNFPQRIIHLVQADGPLDPRR